MLYRKNKHISISILLMLVQGSACLAQTDVLSADSTYAVDDVTVEGSAVARVSMNETIDSAAVVLDNAIGIGGLLKYNSFIYIKDYGPGNISSVSARGGSASQSQVFWNGININQAGIGMTDLSTLPPFLLDHITVQQSASAASLGSGSMAGNVLLSNQPTTNKGLYALLKQSFSSIGERSSGIRIGYNRNKLSLDVRYVYLNSDNTYRFINTAARPYEEEQTLNNAGLLQQGYSATISYTLTPQTTLSFYSWFTHFDRNLPPTLKTITKVNQQDLSYRNSFQLQRKNTRSQWNYKLAYLRDQSHYKQRSSMVDNRILSEEEAFTDNLVNQLDYVYDVGKGFSASVGMTQLYQSIISDRFAQGVKARNRVSIYGGLKWTSKAKRTQVTALVREELYAAQVSPFIYSLQVDQQVVKQLAFSLKGEKHYRIPTMNDLYWGKGGNPDLRPESGWGAEAGLTYVLDYHKIKNTTTVNVFTRTIQDWILWFPTGEYSYWTAQNINEAWSRGIEFKNDLAIQFSSKASITLSLKHTYQKSTQLDRYAEDGKVYQKQLVYTPIYLGNAGLIMQYKQFAISYFQQYTSWVFISADERYFLDPYTYAMLRLQAGHTIGKNRVDVFAEADNCWNSSYQTVKDRPMPLRYYRAGIIYKWN